MCNYPMTDCGKLGPLIVHGGVTGPKVTKAPLHMYICFKVCLRVYWNAGVMFFVFCQVKPSDGKRVVL